MKIVKLKVGSQWWHPRHAPQGDAELSDPRIAGPNWVDLRDRPEGASHMRTGGPGSPCWLRRRGDGQFERYTPNGKWAFCLPGREHTLLEPAEVAPHPGLIYAPPAAAPFIGWPVVYLMGGQWKRGTLVRASGPQTCVETLHGRLEIVSSNQVVRYDVARFDAAVGAMSRTRPGVLVEDCKAMQAAVIGEVATHESV